MLPVPVEIVSILDWVVVGITGSIALVSLVSASGRHEATAPAAAASSRPQAAAVAVKGVEDMKVEAQHQQQAAAATSSRPQAAHVELRDRH
jgi:hypothetical protein